MERGEFEGRLRTRGSIPIGIDEVGRGCLAGPVFAGSVILNYELFDQIPKADLALIRDSKTLSQRQRTRAVEIIHETASSWQLGSASSEEIDSLGILQATFLAMRRSLPQSISSDHVLLVDGQHKLPDYKGQQHAIIKGDNLCYAIAAASIIAKEIRDSFMRSQSDVWPGYGFENHVGYGTKAHLTAISEHGVCPLHRRSFAPIRNSVTASLS